MRLLARLSLVLCGSFTANHRPRHQSEGGATRHIRGHTRGVVWRSSGGVPRRSPRRRTYRWEKVKRRDPRNRNPLAGSQTGMVLRRRRRSGANVPTTTGNTRATRLELQLSIIQAIRGIRLTGIPAVMACLRPTSSAFGPSRTTNHLNGSLALDAGKELRFRYRVVIRPGDTVTAGIEKLYRSTPAVALTRPMR